MPAWPSTLPQATLPGHELAPDDSVIRTDMEAGRARARRRYTRAPTRTTVRWVFATRQQFHVFESWWVLEIDHGASGFTLSLPNGAGMSTVTARFVEPYKARPLGGSAWEVTGTLEVEQYPILTAGALAPFL